MSKYVIKCPCCGEEIKIAIDSDGGDSAITIVIDKIPISTQELSNKFGIELGTSESEVITDNE
jgi:hypothetical protein|nr:MAG TPA: cysteine-rich protein [Caudoviricetes sp.]DAL11429.1 MAG TPA_asm: cysteine-rich protein [Caudoviricetes sp.]